MDENDLNLVHRQSSYEAYTQRMGRVGRCKDGVYIPALSIQALNNLPKHYESQEIPLDTFMLRFYARGADIDPIAILS